MAPKKPLELVDIVADAMHVDIIDREKFTCRLNEILIDYIAPRLYKTELEKNGIISPKRASDDAQGPREVKHG